jgi:hypothetical protein
LADSPDKRLCWGKWSERQDLNLRRLGPKPSALARLSYVPINYSSIIA